MRSKILFLAEIFILLGAASADGSEIQNSETEASRAKKINEEYIGNIDSMKFHLPSCEFAKIMAKRRRVFFQSREKAKLLGMSPCNWCMPSWTLSVEARLLEKTPDSDRVECKMPPQVVQVGAKTTK